ncbi:transmembrane protein 209-like [Drosophila eugracilis]|uniref:transmembrane protein 209-like n=1 Tax=Drosophila eugracilis TaxID=29029 RepID=UPI0007E61074|nr:transmembrane protein 209-like [Drosophila eugracilis]
MNCRSILSPPKSNPLVQRSLDLRLRIAQAKNYLKRCLLNVVILSLLLLDIRVNGNYANRKYWLYLTEYLISTVLALSALACFVKYLWLIHGEEQVIGTANQKYLLDGRDENIFGTVCIRPKAKPLSYKPETWPFIYWHSSFHSCRRRANQCQIPLRVKTDSLMSNCTSPYDQLCRDDFITDIRKLPALIKRAEMERCMVEEDKNKIKRFQMTCSHPAKQNSYQFTPLWSDNFVCPTNCSKVEKPICPNNLLQYVANLRSWISITILHRLVKEIEYVDKAFLDLGHRNFKIGSLNLEVLRLIAQDRSIVNPFIPMMPMVLAFLDTFNNQEYLVQRIKELSEGSYIANYRWKSDRASNGQEWTDDRPTDAAILFHLFCVYLDSQLMTAPPDGRRRPFYSRYVIIRDENSNKDIVSCVSNKANCAILATSNMQPYPKFNFIDDKKMHDCAYDSNNLFHVIIQFLKYMREKQESVLECVSLGKSGINIIGVIED